jgi:hypothetical protein
MTRIAAVGLIGLFVGVNAFCGQTPAFPSSSQKKITVVVKGKEKTYFGLVKDKPLSLKLAGPGTLTIVTRVIVAARDTAAASYSIDVRERTTLVKQYRTRAAASDATAAGMTGVPGKSRKFTIAVPPGNHAYELLLAQAPASEAMVRFLFSRTAGKREEVNLQASSYDRIVTAVVKEKMITYYVASKSKNVTLTVVGPTTLTVTTRLNFEPSMTGRQGYTVHVAEGNRQAARQALFTTKSMASYYRELKDVVAGKPETFSVEVPEGKHTYVFSLLETAAKSVSLKLSIPQSDVDKSDE